MLGMTFENLKTVGVFAGLKGMENGRLVLIFSVLMMGALRRAIYDERNMEKMAATFWASDVVASVTAADKAMMVMIATTFWASDVGPSVTAADMAMVVMKVIVERMEQDEVWV